MDSSVVMAILIFGFLGPFLVLAITSKDKKPGEVTETDDLPEPKISLRGSSDGVTIVDVKMPFWSMVVFMVKFVIASIPAAIILFVIGTVLSGLFLGFAGNL